MTIGGVPRKINKPWFINPGLTLLLAYIICPKHSWYFFLNIYILMNDSDLTATSLEWWLVKGNYRKLAELSDLWIIVIFPVSITLEGNFISLFSVCDPHFTWTNSNPKILMQYLISPDFGINLPNLSKSSNRIPQHRSIILPYEIAISRVPFLDAPNHTTG
jgi:hypothetical protein